MKIVIDTRAFAKSKAVLRKYPHLVSAGLQTAMVTLAEDVRKTAVTKLRDQGGVDSGLLMNSIAVVQVGSHHLVVGTNVAYAAAVEYGTRGHWLHIDSVLGFRLWLKRHNIPGWNSRKFFYVAPKPRPYFEPAFEHGKAEAPKIVQSVMASLTAGFLT